MIFTKLAIENFGVYASKNTFYLRPHHNIDDEQPIILFGGKNGAGKSTILDAVRICLYGLTALGNRVRKKDYERYITQRIHRNSGDKASKASIELTFEHTHVGVFSTYTAIRSWDISGKSFAENILIYKNEEILNDIPKDHWNDFLRDLIPPGVADLFFFDGEQIQALANSTTESDALADAMRGLLNLDLVERLNTDLNIYLRQQKQQGLSALEQATHNAISSYEKTQEQLVELKRDRAELNTILDHARNQLEKARQALLSEGAGFVENRDQIKQERLLVEQQISQTSNLIRELSAELLPFAIAPQWSDRVRERLRSEESAQRSELEHNILNNASEELKQYLLSEEFVHQKLPNIPFDEWNRLVQEITDRVSITSSDSGIDIRHPISEQTRHILYQWIDAVMSEVPHKIQDLTSELERLEKHRAKLERAFNRIPEDMVANPLLDEFQKWSSECGSLEERLDTIAVEMHRYKLQLSEDERQIQSTRQALSEAEGLDLRVQQAIKAQIILDQYLERITSIKIQELEDTFVEYFNLLARKKGMVHGIAIDPDNFTTELYSADRQIIPKTDLSAGEKQLYAMALLWSLRTVSGRNLPIIMDTPMGRLDTDHRAALLENFFPFASHQVIILSTDSEIDVDAYNELEDSISHTYRLEFDEEEGRTRVIEGYFGQKRLEITP